MGLVQSTTNGTKKEGEEEEEGDGKIMQVTRREPEKRGEQSNASGRERDEERERDRKIRKYLLVVPIFTQKKIERLSATVLVVLGGYSRRQMYHPRALLLLFS